ASRVGARYRWPAYRHGRGTQPESGTQRERCCRTSPLPSTEADRRACNRRRDSCCRGTSRQCRRPAARREAGTQLSCPIFNARRAWHEARAPLNFMPGKRVQFDDGTWQAIRAVCQQTDSTFQEIAAEAFADLLKKHHQPVGFMAALEESLGGRGKRPRKRRTVRPLRKSRS